MGNFKNDLYCKELAGAGDEEVSDVANISKARYTPLVFENVGSSVILSPRGSTGSCRQLLT